MQNLIHNITSIIMASIIGLMCALLQALIMLIVILGPVQQNEEIAIQAFGKSLHSNGRRIQYVPQQGAISFTPYHVRTLQTF